MTNDKLELEGLANCPWCGGQPKSWMVGDEDGGYWAVECYHHHNAEQTTFCGVHGDDKAIVEAAWNRRASNQCTKCTSSDASAAVGVKAEGPWCQPMKNGEHQPRQFIIYYEDPSVGIAAFDSEADARDQWERSKDNWNCYLFGSLPLLSTVEAPQPQAVAIHLEIPNPPEGWPEGFGETRDPAAFRWLPIVIDGPCGVSSWYVLCPDGGRVIITAEDYAASEPMSAPVPPQAVPAEVRNEEFGFVEFINQDVPYIVREIDGHVAILLDVDTRAVIGYRVYDPAAPLTKDSDHG